jgi:osmoprotectant transport system substrate-binding protein
MSMKILRLFAAFSALALLLTACGDDADSDADSDADGGDTGAEVDEEADSGERGAITVGSADFDENVIVAAMYAAVLEEEGYDVERRFSFGNREAYFAALEGGELDLVPEYVGTAVEFLTGGAGEATGDVEATTERLRELVAEEGLEVLEPAAAQNANGFVVTRETADELDLTTLSDLEPVAGDLVLGGPPECPERPLCALGLNEVYGIEFGDFQPLDVGGPVTVQALDAGDIDVALLFTTDESIRINNWVLLEDDQELQPAENLAPVVRGDVVDDTIRERLNAISAELTTDELTELNRRVRFDGEDPEDVAENWLREKGLLS